MTRVEFPILSQKLLLSTNKACKFSDATFGQKQARCLTCSFWDFYTSCGFVSYRGGLSLEWCIAKGGFSIQTTNVFFERSSLSQMFDTVTSSENVIDPQLYA